jgi:hypothetical protein
MGMSSAFLAMVWAGLAGYDMVILWDGYGLVWPWDGNGLRWLWAGLGMVLERAELATDWPWAVLLMCRTGHWPACPCTGLG